MNADLINMYRDINVDHDWSEWVELNLRDDMAAIGFEVEQMYFSGFWCQGDGACFTGRMRDWKLFCEKVPSFVEAFPYLSEYLKDEGADYKVTHRGRYYHAYSTTHDYESRIEDTLAELKTGEAIDELLAKSQPEGAMRLALYKKAQTEEPGVEDWLKSYFRNHMHDLYRTLEAEYEHLTGDEAVWDSIVANNLENANEAADDIPAQPAARAAA